MEGTFFRSPGHNEVKCFWCVLCPLSKMPRTGRIEQQRKSERSSACSTSAGLAGQPSGAWMLLLAV